ncbi:hypothetical protein AMJ44_13435 [candidate division WOR-1 bacterium DG_54_3]|uniref:Cation/H+ exchanger transmembrane domain-containing protein n=1 Tax=candidate division WOR-1 bacterium DG_54_3 TaxID=1703775 RepID=A0A0S7XNK6_UNCSA|nr:MAG: hypothetical protein AMJ44_13435 [candidate division WOR-1 bacterium DG_54_3]
MVVLLIAYLAGRFFERINLTKILGYILVGMMLGPIFLNWFTAAMYLSLDSLIIFALAFIAFLIGLKLQIQELKKMGRQIFEVTFFQAFSAFFSVSIFSFIFMNLFNLVNALPTSIILGAIAMATAPATVFAVVDEFKAKGPFTTLLLAIVAIDDGVAIVVYTLVLVFVSFIIQGVILMTKKIKDQNICGVSLIFLLVLLLILSEYFQISPMISAMLLGFLAVNFNGLKEKTIEQIGRTEDLIFIFFFVTAGASLKLGILYNVGLLALVYVLARWAGKVLGGAWGAKISGAEEKVRRWLGWGLLPQAGVAIAFVHMTARMLPQISEMVMAIVLASIVLDEIIGPLGVELALFRAGEARRV